MLLDSNLVFNLNICWQKLLEEESTKLINFIIPMGGISLKL